MSRVASLFALLRKIVQRWMKRSEEHYAYVTEQNTDYVLTEFHSDPALTVEEVRKELTKAYPGFPSFRRHLN